MPNGASAISSRNRPTCRIVGRYAQQDAARAHRLHCVLHDPPRFRQVQDDAIDIPRVDAFVDVTYLHVEWHVVAEKRVDVSDRALREVVADLVAGHAAGGADGAQQRGRERAGAHSGLEDPGPGNTSARMRIGPMSFG